MTKADLVEQVTASIARTAGPMISKKDCARVVDAFLEAVKDALQDQLHIMGENARDFLEPQRIAVTGRTVSTGVYESIHLIGRDEAVSRYRSTLGRLAELWVA